MTYWQQPWERIRLGGLRCRMQILDPRTAFELEPQIIEELGDHLALALAAPERVLSSVWDRALADVDAGSSLSAALASEAHGPAVGVRGLASLGRLLATAVAECSISGSWLSRFFGLAVLDKLEVEGELVVDAEDWSALGLGVEARWRAMAAAMKLTFAPLWLRSPYQGRRKVKDYGVADPTSVPVAVGWADALAVQGHAASSHEILTSWTPVRMIEVVEVAACSAERERRAYDEARGTG